MKIGIREFVFVLLLLGMIAASYIFILEPGNRQREEALTEIRQKEMKLQELQAATKNIDDLGREIDKLTEAVEIFEQKLPVEQEVEVMLREVWQLAARHGLTPKSVRTDKVIKSNDYAEMPINMTIYGNFDGFYSFLLDLEKLRRITRMPQMKLKKTNDQEGAMEAEVVLSIFFDAQSKARRMSEARTGSGL